MRKRECGRGKKYKYLSNRKRGQAIKLNESFINEYSVRVTALPPVWPISAMFTHRLVSAPITCILSTAALLKLCHNKTIFMQKYNHNGNSRSVFNFEGKKNMMYLSLQSAILQVKRFFSPEKILLYTVYIPAYNSCRKELGLCM